MVAVVGRAWGIMEHEPQDERVVRSNGWLLIRNTDKDTQWIATDSPVEIMQ